MTSKQLKLLNLKIKILEADINFLRGDAEYLIKNLSLRELKIKDNEIFGETYISELNSYKSIIEELSMLETKIIEKKNSKKSLEEILNCK